MTVTMYSDVWSLVEMERWSVQHSIAVVNCLSKQSVTATQGGFQQQFQILQYQTTSFGVTSKLHRQLVTGTTVFNPLNL
jgi:hypothetical protein